MASAPIQISVSREWLELLKHLPEQGRVIVIGPMDSGKSTLCRWLGTKLPPSSRVVIVDADLGQSQIGPPGCIAWRFVASSDPSPYEFYFVGDTTPTTRPAVTLAATHQAVKAAEKAGAGVIIVDTSGYLGGQSGFEFKSAKLELLAPAHVILIGDSPEIKRLLAAWHSDIRLTIHRLPQTDCLRQKTREQRIAWRQQKWAKQFQHLDLRCISLSGKMLSGLPTATELQGREMSYADLQGLLLGFFDQQRRGICLGLLYAIDLRKREMIVRAPKEAENAPGIMFGTLRLTPEGQELGRVLV